MKVLFAVSSESISDAIVKRYQKEYKEILSYKNVYYFNAILKEIQKDKSYDRIVISEDLESFSNNNYEAIDKFVFEKLDSISDEAQDIEGNETDIILICSDRHTKGSSFLVKIFGIGIYNALLGNDRSMDQVCKLINKPRVKKEAKTYYSIDADDVNYNNKKENEVSEAEIRNILMHFRKLGRNTEKYTESFNNIASQYTDEQLKIIINCLPINVKAVLEAESPKYKDVMSSVGIESVQKEIVQNKNKDAEKQTGVKIDLIESKLSQNKVSGPIVIPSSVKTAKNQGPKPMSKRVEIPIDQNEKKNVKRIEKSSPIKIEKKEEAHKGLLQKKRPASEDDLVLNDEIDDEMDDDMEEKRGRGRPRKYPIDNNPKPKGKRGRPRKAGAEEEEVEDDFYLPGMDDDEEYENEMLPGVNNDNGDILPGFDDDELADDAFPGVDEFDDDTLPTMDDVDDEVEETRPPVKGNFDDVEDDDEFEEVEDDDAYDEAEAEEEYEDEEELPELDDDEEYEEVEVDDGSEEYEEADDDEYTDEVDIPGLDDDDEFEEVEADDDSKEYEEVEEESDETELPELDDDEEYEEVEVEDDTELADDEFEEVEDDDAYDEAEAEEEYEDEVELPDLDDEYEEAEPEEEYEEVEEDDAYDEAEAEEEYEDETELPDLDDEEYEEVEVEDDSGEYEEESDETELPELNDDEEYTDEVDIPGLDDDDEYTDEVELPELDELDDLDDFDNSDLPGDDVDDDTMLPDDDFNDVGSDDSQDDLLVDFDDSETEAPVAPVAPAPKPGQADTIKPKVDYSMSSLNSLLTKDKKIVTFIGTTKNGTSFLINNLAALFSSLGINTAILDMTKNRNSYYIYTNNQEDLRNIAFNSISKLQKGFAEGIKVDKNLSVYTALPNDGKDYSNAEPILSTLVQNHSLILIDCDYDTDPSYFAFCQEIYLVQSMDILTIQPLTAFLRDLKTQGVLESEKVRVVINKELKVKNLTDKVIIGGMSFYNDPSMSFMTELFNKDMVKYCSIPFDQDAYSKYLYAMAECKVSISNYSKPFLSKLKILGDMIYPLVGKSGTQPSYNNFNQMK